MAPTLWNCYTVTLLQMLCQKLSHEHVLRCLTLFADDLISTQEFRTWEDALDSVRSLEVVLTTLETMGMVINFDKTAVLLSANGTLARKLRRLLTVKVSGRLCVVLRVSDGSAHPGCRTPCLFGHSHFAQARGGQDRPTPRAGSRSQVAKAETCASMQTHAHARQTHSNLDCGGALKHALRSCECSVWCKQPAGRPQQGCETASSYCPPPCACHGHQQPGAPCHHACSRSCFCHSRNS